MHVYFTPRARAALLRMGQRWREKARHPEVFESDISIVMGRLASVPTTGFRAKTTKRRVVYRMDTALANAIPRILSCESHPLRARRAPQASHRW